MPREVFVAGQILTAAELNTVSDQTVMVFAGTAARGSAIPTPTEGMVTYLSDSNLVEAYTGAAFKPVAGVLQVVSTTKTDTFSASVADGVISADVTGLTATITPQSTSSKILVSYSLGVSSSNLPQGVGVHIFRAATEIGRGDAASNRQRVNSQALVAQAFSFETISANFVDSPATTSATTYSLRLSHTAGATRTLYVNRSLDDTDQVFYGRGASTITVMEVAG